MREVLRQRISAYGVCLREGKVLLARWVASDGSMHLWTMPGGRVEHGEDPLDAMVRELVEETGYEVEAQRLLGIDSIRQRAVLPSGVERDFHGVRIVYEARIVGGELRDETGGSTDRAAWFDLAEVADLERVDLVDAALALQREAPTTGRLTSGPPRR